VKGGGLRKKPVHVCEKELISAPPPQIFDLQGRGYPHPAPSCYHTGMPILSNPKHEKFAQSIVRGKSQTDAYMIAGYSPYGASGNASRLIANDSISGRIKELQMAQLEQSQENLCEKLLEINNLIDRAANNGQFNAAIKGFAIKMRLLGMI